MKSRKIESAGALVEKAEKDPKVQKSIGKKKPGKRGRPAQKTKDTQPPTTAPDQQNQVVDEPSPEVALVPAQGGGNDDDEPQGENPPKTRGITWAEADTQLKDMYG